MKDNDLDSLRWELNRHGRWLYPRPEDYGDGQSAGVWGWLFLVALVVFLLVVG